MTRWPAVASRNASPRPCSPGATEDPDDEVGDVGQVVRRRSGRLAARRVAHAADPPAGVPCGTMPLWTHRRSTCLREVLVEHRLGGPHPRVRALPASLHRPRCRLLLVGTPTQEPWHLAAHLDDESRYAGLPTLSPTLVRWSPPPGAPPHLSYGLDRLEAADRGETLFVVAPDDPTEGLLERLADARRSGATLLTIDTGDADLAGLAHDRLIVPARGLTAAASPRASLSASSCRASATSTSPCPRSRSTPCSTSCRQPPARSSC